MVTIASDCHVLFPKRADSLLGMMLSVPGADRCPRAGSPRGVVDATVMGPANSTVPLIETRSLSRLVGILTSPSVSRFSITLCFAYYQPQIHRSALRGNL